MTLFGPERSRDKMLSYQNNHWLSVSSRAVMISLKRTVFSPLVYASLKLWYQPG